MDNSPSNETLRALVGGLFALAIGVALVGVLMGWSADTGPSDGIRIALATGSFTAAAFLRVERRLGNHRLIFLPLDAAFVVSLLLVPVQWVPAAGMAGMASGSLIMRQPAIKLLFNSARAAIASSVALGAISPTGLSFDNKSVVGMLALLLAALVFDVVGNLLTALVVGSAEGLRPLALFWSNITPQAVTAAGNLALTGVGLTLARMDVRLLIAVPLAAVLLHQGYVGRMRGREERAAGARLTEAVRTLASLEEGEVIRRAAVAATDLLSATAVEVIIREPGACSAKVYRHGAGTGDKAEVVANHLAASEFLDADGETSLGEIRIYFAAEIQLAERERHALRTLAAATYTALQMARAHARTARLAEIRAYEASHDPLTRLPNRSLLLERIDAHLDSTPVSGPGAALALIRLDHFSEIASTLGFAAQDALLNHVAARLNDSVVLGELPARVGANEFAVFFHEAADPAAVINRTQRLVSAVGVPLKVDAAAVGLVGTAGVAFLGPSQPATASELLRQASVAVERAARLNIDVELYRAAQDMTGPGALLLNSELRTALIDRQLTVLYQPILELGTGDPVAAEASVWWRHPSYGLVSPEDFLPALESGNLLPVFTEWLLSEALEACGRWSAFDIDVPVSVNLSARSLLDRELPGRVAAALARSRLAPDRLMLELAASSALSSMDTVDAVLEDLLQLGVRLAIDDFGTGHSSLTRLLRVPATDLKIAPEFVEGMVTSPQARTIVRVAIEIAQSYDLRAIAVGVRTAAHAAAIRDLGGHAGQGDLYFPPLDAHRAGAALRLAASGAEATPTADVIPLRTHRGWPDSAF